MLACPNDDDSYDGPFGGDQSNYLSPIKGQNNAMGTGVGVGGAGVGVGAGVGAGLIAAIANPHRRGSKDRGNGPEGGHSNNSSSFSLIRSTISPLSELSFPNETSWFKFRTGELKSVGGGAKLLEALEKAGLEKKLANAELEGLCGGYG